MQDLSPQDPIDRLANIVEQFIDVSSRRIDQMERVTLRQQSTIGITSQAIVRLEERHNELAAQTAQAQEISLRDP